MDFKLIGEYIKSLRKERGESQQQLAESINMDRSNISRIESGKIIPTLDCLESIAKHFNISIEKILCSKEEKCSREVILKSLYAKFYKNNKMLKILIAIIISAFLLFLCYFFFSFYNSVKVFSIRCDEDNFKVTNGVILKTRDKVYLSLNPVFSEENVKDYSLKYKIDGMETSILTDSIIRPIEFYDSYDHQEYITFPDFKRIIDTLYLEINYKDGSNKKYKLNVMKQYSNSKIFINYQNRNEKVIENKSYVQDDIITKIIDKYVELGKIVPVTYNNKQYYVLVTYNTVSVVYDENENDITLKYILVDGSDFLKSVGNETIYIQRLGTDYCNFDCSSFSTDYTLFFDVINKIIE